MMSSHLTALKEKHETIEKSIKDEMKHPYNNAVLVERLKKQKLHIKEEIMKLEEGNK